MAKTDNITKAKARTKQINDNFNYLDTEVKKKVDAVTGKGLSTNDFTDALQTKLNALPTNAELQSGYMAKDGDKVLSDENFTSAEKTKLAGLSNYDDTAIKAAIAEKQAQLSAADLARIAAVDNKANSADVYTKEEINGKLTAAMHFKGSVASVSALPANAEQGDMYNVTDTGANYAFDGTNWDKLSENVDLSGFYTKQQADAKFLTEHQSLADYALTANVVSNTTYTADMSSVNSNIALKANTAEVYSKTDMDTYISDLLDGTIVALGE